MSNMKTPYYVFDADAFAKRVELVKRYLPKCPLTYSMKANPFLLKTLPEGIDHVEVCSPGELEICIKQGIEPDRIIYSGVVKEATDIHKAITYGVDIITCESISHAMLIQQENKKKKVLIRISSGNQFGMSLDDVISIIRQQKETYFNLDIIGIHYYSGTQKKTKKISRDLEKLENILQVIQDACGYIPSMVEYGPGLYTEYYEDECDFCDEAVLKEVAPLLQDFSQKYMLGIEMGRFLATPCGEFYTEVKDIKSSFDTNYLMVDGGIHHINYYGQNMAMLRPEMKVIKNTGEIIEIKKESHNHEDRIPYCICGSLCTVADVIIREVKLPAISCGDIVVFGRCGAYSVTETPILFLSRTMPAVYLKSKEAGQIQVRKHMESAFVNMHL